MCDQKKSVEFYILNNKEGSYYNATYNETTDIYFGRNVWSQFNLAEKNMPFVVIYCNYLIDYLDPFENRLYIEEQYNTPQRSKLCNTTID